MSTACTHSNVLPAVICPLRDYDMAPSGLVCYRYVQTRTDYITANRTCVREGGTMVYVETAAENEYINTNYFTGRGSEQFWIGLNDLVREGTFRYCTTAVCVAASCIYTVSKISTYSTTLYRVMVLAAHVLL